MNISPSRLASPSLSGPGHSMLASPTPTDIQDTSSSHSDHLTGSLTIDKSESVHNGQTATADQYQDGRKNPKTEYKSNFTPFDQYVYNEVTDSFVKQQHAASGNNLLIESTSSRLSASNSNHDLSSLAHSDVHGLVSPALEVSVFEPTNGSDHHYDVTKEPWYKEVVRRNEKAHEYRFKSEVGHSSPLLRDASPNDEFMTRKSPLFSESASTMQHSTFRDEVTSSSPAQPDELSSKRFYKFTPQDYKRDHLISTMADNNSFMLPKKSHEVTSKPVAQRRGQPPSSVAKSNSARLATRSPAQIRAKSQSSRQPTTSSCARAEPASRSNQTTPVKTATPRLTTSAGTPNAATKHPRPTAAFNTSSRLTARTSSTTDSTKPAPAITRRAPLTTSSTKTATSTASRLSSTKSSGATPALVSARPTTARSSTVTVGSSAAKSGTQTTLRSPVKKTIGTTATSRTNAVRVGRPSTSTLTSKAPIGRGSSATTVSTSSNAVKSIKTKALADAGEKAANAATAAASAAPASAATIATLSAGQTESPSGETDTKIISVKQEPIDIVQEFGRSVAPEDSMVQPSAQIMNSYFSQEPNLIFATSETGNMLADEIAQAEREANENMLKDRQEQVSQQVNDIKVGKTASNAETLHPEPSKGVDKSNQIIEQTESSDSTTIAGEHQDLVNGLKGGITSAEDRYDSSERETSADFEIHQADHNDANNDDEPYSIMPTTYADTQQSINEPVNDELCADKAVDLGEPPRSPELVDEKEEVGTGIGSPLIEQVTDNTERAPEKEQSNNDGQATVDRTTIEHKPELIPGCDQLIKAESNENVRDILKFETLNKHVEFASQPEIIESDCQHVEVEDIKDLEEADQNINHAVKEKQVGFEKSANSKYSSDEEFEILEPEKDEIIESTLSKRSPVNVDAQDRTGDISNINPQKNLSEESVGNVNQEVRQKESTITEQGASNNLEQSELISESEDQLSTTHPLLDNDIQSSFAREAAPKVDSDGNADTELATEFQPDAQSLQTNSVNTTQHQAGFECQTDSNSNQDGDDGGNLDQPIYRNELLMNVVDLVDAESRKKEEMIRKSELARQQSDSQSSLLFSQPREILLSADQLKEQFDKTSDVDTISRADVAGDNDDSTGRTSKAREPALRNNEDTQNGAMISDSEENVKHKPDVIDEPSICHGSATDLVDFGSISPSQQSHDTLIDDIEKFNSSKQVNTSEPEQQQSDGGKAPTKNELHNPNILQEPFDDIVNLNEVATQHQDIMIPHEDEDQAYLKSLIDRREDYLDEDEQLKMSTHLTNSDDDAILELRNTKSAPAEDFSPYKTGSGSRYNEGAGLGLLVQDERSGTAEIAEGLSAEMDTPTVAENRVEMATSMMPEISPMTTFVHPPSKFTQGTNFEDDDDDEDMSLNPNADPIDVAATMSPSSSVAEELLRLSRQVSMTGITSELNEELTETGSNTRKLESKDQSQGLDSSKEQVKVSDGETNTTFTISPDTKTWDKVASETEDQEASIQQGNSAGDITIEATGAINNNDDKFNDEHTKQQQNLISGSEKEGSDAASKLTSGSTATK